ncbi:MAG: phospho-N-acetylmuramoyl-pentapeptide-transferase [Coriobacteriales bacterium]|jgi:phospho-N-acetylmuramoyl-pentapeptide-transferase|nr:phospho-N-acetylmuramoyl-pentapeptide-transferase [Coriobacteriales bacterium]
MFTETALSAYPSFLVFLAVFIAMALTMILLPFWIRLLRVRQIGQQIRADGPEHHQIKQGTPTMGGVIILVAVLITVMLFGQYKTSAGMASLILVTVVLVLTGVMGFIDDMSKVLMERSLGLRPNAKMICLTFISVVFCLAAINLVGIEPIVTIPFLPSLDLGILTTSIPLENGGSFDIPWLYLIFIFILMAGMSNAVNLIDGLDGLAAGTVMITMLVMAAVAYRTDQLNLALFAGAVAGACAGFLWFNAPTASIFMGDTGSLALGAAFAALAVLTGTEVVSLVIGGMFVVEAMSVIIQVLYYKATHKRIFLMAPLHHHFEQKGWSESQVVIRFWILTALLAAVGFGLFFAQPQYGFETDFGKSIIEHGLALLPH